MTEKFLMDLAGHSFEVHVRREKRKSLSIRVSGLNEVQASAPNQMPMDLIREFISQKKQWIQKRLSRYEIWKDWPIPRRYEEGEPILFQGEVYLLRLKIQENWQHYQVFQNGNVVEVWGPDKDPQEVRKILVKWLSGEGKRRIEARLREFAERGGFNYSAFALGNGKTLWGTCRQDGLIRINWRGIFLPPELLDYILLHELCHCKELNHSSRFWAELEKHLPDWRERRKNLKKYGILLGEMRE